MNLPNKSGTRQLRDTAPWPELPGATAEQARMWEEFRQQLDRTVERLARPQVIKGMIVVWRRPLAEIPEGWALCDGSNGTVDLRASFIKCVDEDEEPDAGTVHGSATHTPAGTVSQPSFTGETGETGETSPGQPEGAFAGDALETSEDTAGTPAGENAEVTAGTPSGTLASGGSHTHGFTQSANAGTPDLVAADVTGAGVAASGTTGSDGDHTHDFTGDELAAHTHEFTGEELAPHKHTITPAGEVSIDRMPVHRHEFTPAGTVSQPTFTGTPAGFEPRHYKLAFIEKL